MYHTGAFDDSVIRSKYEIATERGDKLARFANRGIYFTADPNYSAQYGRTSLSKDEYKEGAVTYPVFLSVQKPFVIENQKELTALEKIKKFLCQTRRSH